MLSRVAAFGAAFLIGYRTRRSLGAFAWTMIWCLTTLVCKGVRGHEGRGKMRFVAEEQIIALQVEAESLRGACESMSMRLVSMQGKVSRLEQELRAALTLSERLEAEVAKSRENEGARVLSEQERFYARLGLTPSVPDAFLPHVRRAVLMTLHPDRHPEHRKAAAQKRFVEAMHVLEKISAERGLG
jgi:hypothetical protein